MTKLKDNAAAAERQAGVLLRAAITVQLRAAGAQTAQQVHQVIGGDYEAIRAAMYRMVKAGVAKSERGGDQMRNSIFCLGEKTYVARNVAMPHRPVVKEWKQNLKRDPLVSFLFGAPAMVAA